MKADLINQANRVQALLRCAMLAEENETSGLDWKGTATVLGLAEEMMGEIIDQIELVERENAA